MSDNLGTDPAKWASEFLMKLDARGNTPREEIALRYFTDAMAVARQAGYVMAQVKREP
jgi:hypothetical protein